METKIQWLNGNEASSDWKRFDACERRLEALPHPCDERYTLADYIIGLLLKGGPEGLETARGYFDAAGV